MTRDELRQLKKDLQQAATVTAEDLQIVLERQVTQRHGTRITNTFHASHSGGDMFNVLLEEVLANSEDVLINAIKKRAVQKYNEEREKFIEEQEAEIARLKAEIGG